MKSTVAQCAALVRKDLKALFPNIKFRVTSDNYSGGDSVNVSYTDALPAKQIEAAIKKYQYGRFDSMTDMYEMTNSLDGVPQTKYLFVRREMSEAVKEQIMNDYIRKFVGCENVEYNGYHAMFSGSVSCAVYRKFCEMSFEVAELEPA